MGNSLKTIIGVILALFAILLGIKLVFGLVGTLIHVVLWFLIPVAVVAALAYGAVALLSPKSLPGSRKTLL